MKPYHLKYSIFVEYHGRCYIIFYNEAIFTRVDECTVLVHVYVWFLFKHRGDHFCYQESVDWVPFPHNDFKFQFPEETSFLVWGWWPMQFYVVLWYRIIIVLIGCISRNVSIFQPPFYVIQLRVYLRPPNRQKCVTACASQLSKDWVMSFCASDLRYLFIIPG